MIYLISNGIPLDGFSFVKVMAHRIGVDNRMGRYPDLAINRNEGKTHETKRKSDEPRFHLTRHIRITIYFQAMKKKYPETPL